MLVKPFYNVLALQLKYAFLLPYLLFVCKGNSQNLVINPSLEEFTTCPERLGNFDDNVVFWSTPTDGSTDYFNACSKIMGTPDNFKGRQPADFGTGYAGMYVYAPDHYREYLQAELSETLIQGKNYEVSFYVSLAERSDSAVKEFGVLFSKDKIAVNTQKDLSKKYWYEQTDNSYNFMEIGYSNFYSDTKDWILVHTQFEAKGDEKYLTLGNFKNNARTRLFQTKKNAREGAYYYVDMISVTMEEPPSNRSELVAITEGKETKNIELDKSYTFKNVLFQFDRAVLLASSREELLKLYDHLKSNANLKIKINGHTDAIGTETYNQQLSEKRAEAVANFLMDLGITKDRIDWLGHGSTQPITNNLSEDGRKENRRVEFIISKGL